MHYRLIFFICMFSYLGRSSAQVNFPVGQYWLVVQAEGRQMSQPLTIVR